MAHDNGLKLTPEEIEKLYKEQLGDEKMEQDEMMMGTDLKEEPLTRAEIENLMKKKGIKLSEDDIQKIMKGDKEALKKL